MFLDDDILRASILLLVYTLVLSLQTTRKRFAAKFTELVLRNKNGGKRISPKEDASLEVCRNGWLTIKNFVPGWLVAIRGRRVSYDEAF
jgi:hypothetical protein